jgi:hypothetical protein
MLIGTGHEWGDYAEQTPDEYEDEEKEEEDEEEQND